MTIAFKTILAAAAIGISLAGCEDTGGAVYSNDGYNRNVLIVNQTGQTIYRFYGSNVGTNSWEEDILGSSVLLSGQSVNINFDDGSGYCNFDFKVEFQDGSYVTESNINVCQISTYTVY